MHVPPKTEGKTHFGARNFSPAPMTAVLTADPYQQLLDLVL